jgi:hypothetical protein
VVSEVRAIYDGTAVPDSGPDMYSQGILLSDNLLSGAQVDAVNGFYATTTLLSGSQASISFSQDQEIFYSASGTKGGWDSLADGGNYIDLSGLGWSSPGGGAFYYKVRLESFIDPAVPAKFLEAKVDYDGTDVPVWSGATYEYQGILASSDLLASTTDTLTGEERFVCNFSLLPANTTVESQFSTDGSRFYDSNGIAGAWDLLSFTGSLSSGAAIDLSSLNWNGAESFYYKIRFTLGPDRNYTPILKQAGLIYYSAIIGGDTKGDTMSLSTSTAYCVPGSTDPCAGPVGEWEV